MAKVEHDDFGYYVIVGDDGEVLGRYANHVDAQNKLMDKQMDALHAAAATLGARGGAVGGKSTSPAKQAAVRENGKLGGRPSYNMQAMREIEAENNRFLSGAHSKVDTGQPDRYAQEHADNIYKIITKYAINTDIIETLPNGIKMYRLTDAKGNIVGEYHDI